MSNVYRGGIKSGSTSLSILVDLYNTDGTAKTGVVHTDLTASYWRQGGSRVAITPSALTNLVDAYASGGWKEVDSTNMPGIYRFDIPDAAFAINADWGCIALKITGANPFLFKYNLDIQAVDSDGQVDVRYIDENALDNTALATSAAQKIAQTMMIQSLGSESYAADGAVPTLAQMLFQLLSRLCEYSVSGTTMTCRKLDGATTCMTFTFNQAVNPTSITRAT